MQKPEIKAISPSEQGMRLDVAVSELFPELTRSAALRLIQQGDCLLNGKKVKAGTKVSEGDTIFIRMPEPEVAQALPEPIPLDILYEDRDLIVVNKPKGMVVHPAPGHTSGTLVNALLYHCAGDLSGVGGVLRPGIVHRIDRNTTGALIAAKNDFAHNDLSAQLKVHAITRRYRAIVCGNLKEDAGTIDAPIGRHRTDRKKMAVAADGRQAVTHYRVLERLSGYTYVESSLETGRTHQIRVHMKHIGHPLLGDDVYGSFQEGAFFRGIPLQGQTLHAMVLGLKHPRTGEYMEWTAPLPEYFQEILNRLSR